MNFTCLENKKKAILSHELNTLTKQQTIDEESEMRFQSLFGASKTFQTNLHLSTCHFILTIIKGIHITGNFYNTLFILNTLLFICLFITSLKSCRVKSCLSDYKQLV